MKCFIGAASATDGKRKPRHSKTLKGIHVAPLVGEDSAHGPYAAGGTRRQKQAIKHLPSATTLHPFKRYMKAADSIQDPPNPP
ncbi:MAG: hypothetical protein QW160_04495 [Candidatus Bathyarchaeia archaeon]